MPTRKTYLAIGWRSVHERYYASPGVARPTSGGAGTAEFPFDNATIDVGTKWSNRPTSSGMSYNLFATKSLLVTDDAAWTDGTRKYLWQHAGITWYAKKNGSNWNLEVHDLGEAKTVTGATNLSFGTEYGISAQRDMASPYTLKIWVDGTLEINDSFAITGSGSNAPTLGQDAGGSEGSFTIGLVMAAFTDTEERIDETSIDIREMELSNGGTPMHDDYTSWTNSGSEEKYEQVDEDPPDDSTTTCGNPSTANSTFRQTYFTTNITMANIQAVTVGQRGQATVGSKNVRPYTLCADGTNKEEVQHATHFTTDWVTEKRCVFDLAPDGGAWTQTDLDNLQVGVRFDIGDDAVTYSQTAMHAEAAGCDFESTAAPAAAADRRRVASFV